MSAATSNSNGMINVRSKSFWLLTLFVVYSLFGWVFVPMILDAQLKSVLKSTAKWDTQIDNITFNPYALSLELTGTEIVEESQNPVVSFERFYLNFNLLKTITGTISFDEINLEKPQIHLDLNKEGETNFQRAFASETPEPPAAESELTEETGEPLALFFNLIAISDGAIYFTDNSKETPFQLELTPLSLSLEEFSTHHNEGGDYSLAISLGNEQMLNWRGQIGIAPFQSSGHLELSRIDSATFWHYVKDASPYWLNQAKVSVFGDYQIASQPDGLQLSIRSAQLQIDDAVLSESQDSAQWLALKQLKVAPVFFDLQTASLDLGQIILDEPDLTISRAPDHSLNILRPLTAQADSVSVAETETEAQTTHKQAEQTKAFKWRLSGIRLKQGEVRWQDQTVSTEAELGIHQLAIEIGAMSEDLSRAFPFDVRFAVVETETEPVETKTDPAVTEAGTNVRLATIKGELSPVPFKLQGQADIPGFNLVLLQPYVQDVANISINNGRFNLTTQYELALKEQLSGTLNSTVRIDQLALTDSILDKPLSGFNFLEIGPLAVSLPEESKAAPSVRIERIVLDQVYGDIFIAEDGRINLSQLAKTASTEPGTPATETASNSPADTTEADSPPAIELLLETFTLNKGQFSYTDASLKPAFTTRVSDLSGTIEGISSAPDAKSKVALSGKLDSVGSIAINGTLNPLSTTPNSHIMVQVKNIDLTTASPYSAKYAGYLIDKGKLDLDLDYLLQGSKIKASNQVLLNQFEFGKSVDSPDATSLPLPFAIGILKDRKGRIDVDLPISGDLQDPSFKLTSVILNTFANLITKAVTSPFSILGGLIEGGDKLSEVAFSANSSELTPAQMQNLLNLTKALQERPNLTLEIRGVADANIDQKETADRQETTVRPEAELIQLAKQRALALNQFVTEQGQIDSARVFVLEPSIIPAVPVPTQATPADVAVQTTATEQTTSTEKTTATAQNASNKQTATVSSKFTLGVR